MSRTHCRIMQIPYFLPYISAPCERYFIKDFFIVILRNCQLFQWNLNQLPGVFPRMSQPLHFLYNFCFEVIKSGIYRVFQTSRYCIAVSSIFQKQKSRQWNMANFIPFKGITRNQYSLANSF